MINNNKISAVLVVFNEEKKIEDCLKSIFEVVNEIVVVHDGECADSTLDICRKYGCKVFIRDHIGSAEPHRPFALSKCTHNWVLQIDADERLSDDLQNKLPKLVSLKTDAYSFRWIVKNTSSKRYCLYKQILFRKNKMYYVGLPHFQGETKGSYEKIDLELQHDFAVYNTTLKIFSHYFKKNKNWGKISAQMLSGSLSHVPVYNCSITDNSLKQVKKIRFIKSFPFFAILLIPLYSLLNNLLKKQLIKLGFFGLVLSSHTALHHFFTCYYMCLNKLSLRKNG